MTNLMIIQHSEVWWYLYASVNWVIIGSDNGLLPFSTKPLPHSMLTFCEFDPLTQYPWNLNQIKPCFLWENTFENVNWKLFSMPLVLWYDCPSASEVTLTDMNKTELYQTTSNTMNGTYVHNFDGLVQERSNSIANVLELRLSCTNPSIFLYTA